MSLHPTLCRVGRVTPMLVLASILHLPALAQRTYDCGNLDQRACTTNDWERVNMKLGRSRGCEPDLEEQDGMCRNSRRQTLARNRSWTGWALEQQLYGIGKDTPINFLTWPASHNVYSNVAQGLDSDTYTNHYYSITDQLQAGIRHLEIDPKHFTQFAGAFPIGDLALRVCHAGSVSMCAIPGWGNRLFGFTLKEIADWVDANPGQIIYIKIDDIDLWGVYPLLYDEIAKYLGNRVYRVPTTGFTRWPTIQEIRNARKQIIVAQHNNTPENTPWVWPAAGRLQEKNHPQKQDFNTCVAYDGLNPDQRGQQKPTTWWDVAEGRAKTNSGDYYTGMLWEGDVEKATRCGVSVMGMDFINSLWADRNLEKRTTPADDRLTYIAWSWYPGDYGQAGPAMFHAGSKRWSSRPSSTVLPVVCGVRYPYGSSRQDRHWRITSAQIPWNRELGNAKCVEEFGSTYEFAFPVNGWQNSQLGAVPGITNAWLAYTLVQVPNAAVSSANFVFRMNPGGPLPAAQTLTISAAPGTSAGIKLIGGNAPVSVKMPLTTLSSGQASVPIAITSAATSLPSGEYNYSFEVGAQIGENGESIPVNVKLIVRARPTLTLTADPVQARVGSEVLFSVVTQGGFKPTGSFKVYRIAGPDGSSTGQETVAAGNLDPVLGRAKVGVTNLPAGRNTYTAIYVGDENNFGADSAEIAVTMTQRIVASRDPVILRTTPGVLPAIETVTLTGLAANPTAQALACTWGKIALSGSTLQVGTLDLAKSFTPGSYNCTIRISDSQSQTQGVLDLPVRLYVQTTLAMAPASITRLTTASVSSASIDVTAGGGVAADMTVSANQPWLIPELAPPGKTPATISLTIDAAKLTPGVHTGQVIIGSPLAPSVSVPVSITVVRPVIVTSVPAGRTVTIDGATRTTPVEFVWQPGSTHTVSVVTDQFEDGVRHRFSAWSGPNGASSNSAISITPTAQGGTWQAAFSQSYRLSLDVLPAGGGEILVTPQVADGYYTPGTPLQLQANPAAQYTFTGWLGALSGTNRNGSVTINGPTSAVATFSRVQPVHVTLTSNAPGTVAMVDGSPQPLPATLLWVPGQSYTVAVPNIVPQVPGTQWQFVSWSNASRTLSQTVTAPATDLALSVSYARQFLLTASSAPEGAGTVTGGGWYTEGVSATVGASPASGFRFTGFTGAMTGSTNPQNIVMSAARTVVANFAPSGVPSLMAASGTPRTDGPGPGQRTVPIVIRNSGPGGALDVQISGITAIETLSGSGAVSVITAMPFNVGDIPSGQTATGSLVFQWPATATRVRFVVNLVSNGRVAGSTALTLFR